MSLSPDIPQYARDLMDFYSPPRQDAWGVTIFYERIQPEADLEEVALRQYKYFVGESCEESSPRLIRWLREWKLIYQRTPDLEPNIRLELDAATSVAGLDYDDRIANMLDYDYDEVGPYREPAVLAAGFNSPEVKDFQIYTLGDGEVMEGLLTIARRRNGETLTLAFLDD